MSMNDSNKSLIKATLALFIILILACQIPAVRADGVGSFRREAARAGGGGVSDHGALTGLTDDDHTVYFLLAGRSGGQTVTGGTGAGEDLVLESTSDGTKGNVVLAAGTDLEFTSSADIRVTSGPLGLRPQPGQDVQILGGDLDMQGGRIFFYDRLTESVASTPHTVTNTDDGTMFDNTGAGEKIIHNLQNANNIAGDHLYFRVTDANGMRLNLSTGETLYWGADSTSAGGWIESTTVGSSLTITSQDSTTWHVESWTGTWALDGGETYTGPSAGGGDHTLADSGTSTSAEVVAVQHTTDGTAAAGFGGHIAFDLEDAAGNLEADAATVGASWVDATDTEEDAEILLSVMVAGSLTEVAQVTGSGLGTIAGSETAPSVAFDNSGGGGGVTGLFNWGDEVGVVVDGDVIASFWKEGASNLNLSGQGTNKLRRWRQQVDVSTGTAASPDNQNNNDTLATVTNEGVSAICHVNLPTAVTGHSQTFVVQDADGLRVNANTGDTIRIGQDVTASAGYVESTEIGSTLTLTAINATEWLATSYYGPWTNGSWSSPYTTDWVSYSGSHTNEPTNCTIATYWRRVNDTLEIRVEGTMTGATGASGATSWGLPTGLTIDHDVTKDQAAVGACHAYDVTAAKSYWGTVLTGNSGADTLTLFFGSEAAAMGQQAGNSVYNNTTNDFFSATAAVPCEEWRD